MIFPVKLQPRPRVSQALFTLLMDAREWETGFEVKILQFFCPPHLNLFTKE